MSLGTPTATRPRVVNGCHLLFLHVACVVQAFSAVSTPRIANECRGGMHCAQEQVLKSMTSYQDSPQRLQDVPSQGAHGGPNPHSSTSDQALMKRLA